MPRANRHSLPGHISPENRSSRSTAPLRSKRFGYHGLQREPLQHEVHGDEFHTSETISPFLVSGIELPFQFDVLEFPNTGRTDFDLSGMVIIMAIIEG